SFTGRILPRWHEPVRRWQTRLDPLAQAIPQATLPRQRSVGPRADPCLPIARECARGRPELQEAGREPFQPLVQAIWSWLDNRLFFGAVGEPCEMACTKAAAPSPPPTLRATTEEIASPSPRS